MTTDDLVWQAAIVLVYAFALAAGCRWFARRVRARTDKAIEAVTSSLKTIAAVPGERNARSTTDRVDPAPAE